MASILQVEELRGPTSGANANKVIIPSGQTLDASAGDMTLPAGVGGKLLQVVDTNLSGSGYRTAMTTATWTDVINLTITPNSASSRILITYHSGLNYQDSDNANFYCYVRLKSDIGATTTYFGDPNYGLTAEYIHQGSFNDYGFPISLQYLDSPNTTSSILYKVQFKFSSGSGYAGHDTGRGIMTAMEIAG